MPRRPPLCSGVDRFGLKQLDVSGGEVGRRLLQVVDFDRQTMESTETTVESFSLPSRGTRNSTVPPRLSTK
ncbi:MAG: hypothetical protein ABI783_08025 [Actinomycetota bacterium]